MPLQQRQWKNRRRSLVPVADVDEVPRKYYKSSNRSYMIQPYKILT